MVLEHQDLVLKDEKCAYQVLNSFYTEKMVLEHQVLVVKDEKFAYAVFN